MPEPKPYEKLHVNRTSDLGYWIAVIAFVIGFGWVAIRFYGGYTRVEPTAPVPIKIFRTPNDRDYSSIAEFCVA